MPKGVDRVIIGIICTDPVRTEELRFHSDRWPDFSCLFSEIAEPEKDYDLLVLPANQLEETITKHDLINKGLPEVVAYGSPFYLKRAFLLGCADYLRERWEADEFEVRILRIARSLQKKYMFPWGEIAFKGKKLLIAGSAVDFTYQELNILKMLLRHRGEVVPREVLFYSIWKNQGKKESRAVDVHVAAIRKKLLEVIGDFVTPAERFILSVRGEGYVIG